MVKATVPTTNTSHQKAQHGGRLPRRAPDPNILWSAALGWPAGGLLFHQVIEKEGVAIRRMVYILVIIGSPGGVTSNFRIRCACKARRRVSGLQPPAQWSFSP